MKATYVIAIAFLASWTVITASKLPITFEAENECPAEDHCPPKLIRHDTDCTKYYECKNGQKELRSCAANLYFSKSWGGCVRQEISDCPFTTSPTPPPITTTQKPGCIHGELLPHECKCFKYYECINGRKALRDCPAGQHFNKYTRTCEPGTNCDNSQPETSSPCVEGENIAHECQCNKYYVCKGGRKALRECDKGMHFDKTSKKCVPGEDCEQPKPRVCTDGDMKKHDCLCEMFFKCINNDWIHENCPNGDHFSETEKKCMNPIDARCDKKLIPKPGDCPNSSPSKWPHECDCRLYYQCENGKKKIYNCSWGNYFDKVNLKCDAAANIKNNCTNKWDTWLQPSISKKI